MVKVIVGIFGNKMWGQAAGKTTSGCRAGVITFRVIIAGREWLRSFGRFRWRVRSLWMTEKKSAPLAVIPSAPLPVIQSAPLPVIQSEAKNLGFLGKHFPFLHKHRQNMWPEETPGRGYIIRRMKTIRSG